MKNSSVRVLFLSYKTILTAQAILATFWVRGNFDIGRITLDVNVNLAIA